jgi:hypothetical protein
MNDTPTFLVANRTQQVLFECELKGQLSDGYWENTNPHNHWRSWAGCEVQVNADVQGRSFAVNKDNYNFVAPVLIEAIGARMVGLARIARLDLTWEQINAIHGRLPCASFLANRPMAIEMPTHEGSYWDEQRATLLPIIDMVNAALADTNYGLRQLRVDLKQLKDAARVRFHQCQDCGSPCGKRNYNRPTTWDRWLCDDCEYAHSEAQVGDPMFDSSIAGDRR